MRKKWEFYEVNEEKAIEIAQKHSINLLLAKILVNRGIVEENQINVFLNPTRQNFHDPLQMPDMKIARDRVISAISNQEKVIIYGDYDVDGITSTTVLKSFLEDRGLLVDAYIPNRLDEGYGLNNEALDQIAEDGYKLMITVDCGISAVEERFSRSRCCIQTYSINWPRT